MSQQPPRTEALILTCIDQYRVAPDSEHAHLLMHVYSAAISTQMHSFAADRRIADLERQVSRVTSDLQDVQGDRQGYDRLKLRLDL